MRWAKRFLGIDRPHDGRERQGPALDGRLVPSAKGVTSVVRCVKAAPRALRRLDAACASNDACCRRERFIFEGETDLRGGDPRAGQSARAVRLTAPRDLTKYLTS